MSPKQFQRAATAKVKSALVAAQMSFRIPANRESKIPTNVPHPHGAFKFKLNPSIAEVPAPQKKAKSSSKKRTPAKRKKPATRGKVTKHARRK